MCGLEVDWASSPLFICSEPGIGTHTPSIAIVQSRKPELESRSHQVITLRSSELKKCISHHTTYDMSAKITVICVTTSIPVPTCQRVFGTFSQFSTQNVDWGIHGLANSWGRMKLTIESTCRFCDSLIGDAISRSG